MTPCTAAVYVVVEYAKPAAAVVPGFTPSRKLIVVSVCQLPVVVSESTADAMSVPPVAVVDCASKFHLASSVGADAAGKIASEIARRRAAPRADGECGHIARNLCAEPSRA
jgi:hypothetical protein